MPTVEKVSPGRVYVRRVGQEFALGDRAEVSDADAAYLCDERGDFERVDVNGESSEDVPEDASSEDIPEDEDEDADVSSGDTESEAEAGAGEHEDGNEEQAADLAPDEWLDQDYRTRAERVRDGDVDEHLETIREIETSETVKDAVDDRQED